MIATRTTVPIKAGKTQEFLELISQFKPWYDERNITLRVYTAYYAKYDVVVLEMEYEFLADEEKFDKELWADPSLDDLIPKLSELSVPGRTSEAWVLHEL